MGSEKSEVRSGKWEVGSGKWEVGRPHRAFVFFCQALHVLPMSTSVFFMFHVYIVYFWRIVFNLV